MASAVLVVMIALIGLLPSQAGLSLPSLDRVADVRSTSEANHDAGRPSRGRLVLVLAAFIAHPVLAHPAASGGVLLGAGVSAGSSGPEQPTTCPASSGDTLLPPRRAVRHGGGPGEDRCRRATGAGSN